VIRVDRFLHQPSCPVCGSSSFSDLGRIAYGPSPIEFSSERIDVGDLDARLLECTGCGARRTSPIVPPELTAPIYAAASAGRWSGDVERFESTLRKADVVIPEGGGRVLDYGCYTGGLLDCFRARGWQTFGVDLCRSAVEVAGARGHRVTGGGLEALSTFTEPFDVITLFDVIEHVIDPVPLLSMLASLLKPEGELWILTGDAESLPARLFGARWWYVSFGEHVVFYRLANLEAVLGKVGLRTRGASRLRYLDHGRLHRAKNYLTTGLYLAAQPLLAGRTTHRLGAGPPPLFPAVDHLLVRGVRA
jgi:SAM-dependent methyltransferase